ncbi:unnamed protein product [Sphagnum balticum]
MDRALLFSQSTMTSCFACVGFVLKGCLEILDLVARTLESIPSDEDYDAGSILNDAGSIPSDAGSISNDADSILRDADSIPGDTNSSLRDIDSVAAETFFKHCRDAATAVRSKCERVRFNKSLCRFLADTYSRYLHSDFDFTYANECQTILAELRRVISCGEMLVEQWTDKDWWMSVVSSSDSASIKERVVLHLNEFLFCVKVLRLVASNGAVPEGTSFMPLDLSMPDVEEASRRDTERLLRIVEGYKAKSVPQGAVEKLAELALDKLSATTSDAGQLRSIEYDDVQLAGFLGRGAFGLVFECRLHGQMAAAKILQFSFMGEREANLQARLRHPNVLQFIGHAVTADYRKPYIIVMELMNMDLRQYLDENVRDSQSRHPLSLLLAVDIMLQLAEAMNYLHKSRVIHRDLNSGNVLINAVTSKESYISPSVQVKLTDFGLSKLNLNNSRFFTMDVGTRLWMAPEVWLEENTENYTKAADVYSFAMVFFEVLTGEIPFQDKLPTQLLQCVLKGERPILPPDDYCPVHVSAVIKKCWATMPEDRPQFHEICQMLWQCKARILSHSSPHSSPWNSEPQKHRNDGGDSGGIVTTGNNENLFQGPGMMANISAGDFRATIEYNDVQLKIEYLGEGGYAPVVKCQFHGEVAAAKLFNTSNTIEAKAVKNEAKLLASLRHPNVVQFIGCEIRAPVCLTRLQHHLYLGSNTFDIVHYTKISCFSGVSFVLTFHCHMELLDLITSTWGGSCSDYKDFWLAM